MFDGPSPSRLREQGMIDARAGKPCLSQDPNYRRGYSIMARYLAPSLLEFVKNLPEGIGCAEAGRLCMSFLMRRQYGTSPPNPCPCY